MDMRNGVTVGYRDVIEGAVVNTWSPITCRCLRDQIKWGGPRAVRWTNNTELEHVGEFGFCGLQLIRRQSTWA